MISFLFVYFWFCFVGNREVLLIFVMLFAVIHVYVVEYFDETIALIVPIVVTRACNDFFAVCIAFVSKLA